jgi:hypothetical protein
MADKTAEEKEKETKDAADRKARDERMDKVCDWAASKMDAEEKAAKDAAEKEKLENEGKDKDDDKKDDDKKDGKDAGAASRVKDEEEKRAKDAEEKKGMDAAIKKISGLAEDVAILKSGAYVKGMLDHVAQRDKLAARISNVVGSFAHDSMLLSDVVSYGIEKLKIEAPKGHELVALDSYLKGLEAAGRNTDRFALDGDFLGSTKGTLDKFIAEKLN